MWMDKIWCHTLAVFLLCVQSIPQSWTLIIYTLSTNYTYKLCFHCCLFLNPGLCFQMAIWGDQGLKKHVAALGLSGKSHKSKRNSLILPGATKLVVIESKPIGENQQERNEQKRWNHVHVTSKLHLTSTGKSMQDGSICIPNRKERESKNWRFFCCHNLHSASLWKFLNYLQLLIGVSGREKKHRKKISFSFTAQKKCDTLCLNHEQPFIC